MAEAGLREVGTYVYLFHNTAAQFITTRPIVDLCLAAERMPGSRVTKRWWDQDVLDVEGMRTEAQEAERIEGEEEMDGMYTETD